MNKLLLGAVSVFICRNSEENTCEEISDVGNEVRGAGGSRICTSMARQEQDTEGSGDSDGMPRSRICFLCSAGFCEHMQGTNPSVLAGAPYARHQVSFPLRWDYTPTPKDRDEKGLQLSQQGYQIKFGWDLACAICNSYQSVPYPSPPELDPYHRNSIFDR